MSHQLVGKTLAHYRLLRPLGAGAMSEVYVARDTTLGTEVAVKVIHPRFAMDSQQVARFEREARAAARLAHPQVATVYFAGRTAFGAPFFAMELVQGWSFDDLLEARTRFRLEHALALFAQTCAGLQAAYESGIIHRDIKPANLMVTREGVLKIVDFGLAKLQDDRSLTTSGTVVGTPRYLAPEVAKAEPGDHRSDIYSLGVTFFQLLAGYPPFDAETSYAVMLKHVQGPVPSLGEVNPRLPAKLDELLRSMMAKHRDDRPQTYRAIHRAVLDIHAALEPAERNQLLAYCGFDKRNTVGQAGRCTLCGKPYGTWQRPDRYHVDIVGWLKNDAADAVARHIGKAVAFNAVREQLQELPYRAAARVLRARARELQHKLFELGAEVQLVPAESAATTSESSRVLAELSVPLVWPPPPHAAGAVKPGPQRFGRTRWERLWGDREEANGAGPSPATAVLLVMVLVLSGLLVAERRRGDRALERAEALAEALVSEAAVEPRDAPAPTPIGPRSPEEKAAASLLDLSWAVEPDDAARVSVERALTEAVILVGRQATVPAPIPVRVVRSGPESPTDPWTAPLKPAAELVLSGDGAALDQAELTDRARLLVARVTAEAHGLDRLPAWLGLGPMLRAIFGTPGSAEQAIAAADGGHRPVNVGPQDRDSDSLRAVRCFASWLIVGRGADAVERVVDAARDGEDVEVAAIRELGGTPTQLQAEWLRAVRR